MSSEASLIDRSRQYVTDVRSEFKKITWPTQREYVSGTIGVVVVTAFLALVLGIIDFGLGQIMELVLG